MRLAVQVGLTSRAALMAGMTSRPRVPSGVPAGGQFAANRHPEADIELSEPERVTMQTDAPIQRVTMTTTNRPLAWLFDMDRRDDGDALVMDQPYQRGLVWGVARKQKLIRSLLEGVPIPSLIVNNRFGAAVMQRNATREFDDREGGKNWATAVIDGKQRVSAFLGFARDEFAVPASWFPAEEVKTSEDTDDGPYVRWSGLSDRMRRLFQTTPIGVTEGKFATLAEEKEIFDRVNFGGVAQGESDV